MIIMNKILSKFILIILCIISIGNISLNKNNKIYADYAKNYNKVGKFSYSVNKTESQIVMDSLTHRVLYSLNAYDKKFMASTTKILTAITVIENCNIYDNVIIDDKAVGIEGSSIYLIGGEELTVKELLYGLMLRSGNDCAVALALKTSGSLDEFCKLMNKTAFKAGAKNSNFVNPHGLHNENHYTTAYDLALISCYAMKNETFREIVGTKKITIRNTKRDYKRVLVNKNKMLLNYNGATGIKTGYTKNAGRCLVTSAKKDNRELISVVLNCAPMWESSQKNLDYCFKKYSCYKAIESDEILDFIDINGQKIGVYTDKDIYLPISEDEKKTLKSELFIDNIENFPLKKGSKIGKVKFYISNNLIYEQNIYNIISIK